MNRHVPSSWFIMPEHMDSMAWNHRHAEANGIAIHYVHHGSGSPLILLHGWPEFWYTFRKNIPVLSERFDVVAPDLRGFGSTEKPGLPDPPERLLAEMSEDLLALADELGFEQFGLVSHDVGAYVAQAFARRHPERLSGLLFFDCPYPGIGDRWVEADSVNEIWYQSFNQQPWAAPFVGRDRDTCEMYLRHFLDHWSHEPGLFDEDLEVWVDNFMKPGNLQGGFDWYIATNKSRISLISNGPPELPKIPVPAHFLWGESDPIIKAEWADRLGDYFSDYSLLVAPDAGHFVHYERPELANLKIIDFFSGR